MIVAIVGMTGSGKTTLARMFEDKGFQIVRLGQLTLDIIKERELEPTEENERPIREALRKQHGMAAYATQNFAKIDALLQNHKVVLDGLYSWEEYVEFKKRYELVTVAVIAGPKLRYERLSKREIRTDDSEVNMRKLTPEQAHERDISEIENLNKSGPIAMADHSVLNDGSLAQLHESFNQLLGSLSSK